MKVTYYRGFILSLFVLVNCQVLVRSLRILLQISMLVVIKVLITQHAVYIWGYMGLMLASQY